MVPAFLQKMTPAEQSTHWQRRLGQFGETVQIRARLRKDRAWEATPLQHLFLQFIARHPGEYTQRQIADRLGVSPGMVQRNIDAWWNRGVLNKSVKGTGINRRTRLWIQPYVLMDLLASTIVMRTVQYLQRDRRSRYVSRLMVDADRVRRNWTEFWKLVRQEAEAAAASLALYG